MKHFETVSQNKDIKKNSNDDNSVNDFSANEKDILIWA